MITRDSLLDEAKELFKDNKNLLIELPTGTGKSKISLELYNLIKGKCLIVVPERVHVNNWIRDIKKHNFDNLLDNITFICYASLHKYIDKSYNCIIYDEVHNSLSDKRINAMSKISSKKSILLTATITKREKLRLESFIGKFITFRYSLAEAINSDILPEPKIHLIPLNLNNEIQSQTIIINRGKDYLRIGVKCDYKDNWKRYLKIYPNVNLTINCTELEKYQYLCSQIDYYQTEYYKANSIANKNRWMQFASQRKRFIASIKTNAVKNLIKDYKERFICFSSSIDQCNELGGKGNIIHSKITNPDKIIDKFNQKKIDKIFAVDMLKEGMNLVESNAIIVQLDSKSRSAIQMLGRTLRHPNPVIHIFYIKDTQDEIYLKNSLEEFGEFVV